MQKFYCQEEKKIIQYRHNELKLNMFGLELKVYSTMSYNLKQMIVRSVAIRSSVNDDEIW